MLPKKSSLLFIFFGVAVSFLLGPPSVQSASTPTSRDFFEQKIRPILAQDCYECHQSSGPRKGGLALDDRQGLLKGGDSGPSIIPGNPDQSLLIQLIRHEDIDRTMPRSGAKLEDPVIRDFEAWIRHGAPDPRDLPPTQEELILDTQWEAIMNRRKQWWSFQPISSEGTGNSVLHPVDALIQEKLEEVGLEAAPRADKEILMRRLSFALRGLPPSPEELRSYLLDPDPMAYETWVDTFLDSPQYGERWARHWMDWIRYAESHGSEGDPIIPNAWEYRDYLIRALNQDIPYDQLLMEHVAGDLLSSPRIDHANRRNESAMGTAHLRMVFHGFAPTDALEEKIRFTDDQINTLSKAFQAITVSCARCHNHKFDPISQEDYYAWFGIMASGRPGIVDARHRDEKDHQRRLQLKDLKFEIQNLLLERWNKHLGTFPASWEEASESWKTGISDSKSGDLFWPLAKQLESPQAAKAFWETVSAAHASMGSNQGGNQWTFKDPEQASQWFGFGPSMQTRTAAGNWTLESDGPTIVQHVLPAGFYSHLVSSKDPGALHSPRILLEQPMDLWLLINGDGGSMARYAVQHYPRNGTVYPVENLQGGSWRWKRFNLDYWQGDAVHVELSTAADQAVLAKLGQERSWFGARQVRFLPSGQSPENHMQVELYFPLLETRKGVPPKNIDDLLKSYADSLALSLEQWHQGTMTDAQSLWLNQWIQRQQLPNNLDQDPVLTEKTQRWRQIEKGLASPIRVPGILETRGYDQPLLDRGDAKKPLHDVPRGFLSYLDATPYEATDGGRLQLAQDLIRPDNPLTQRVIVNRLWHHLFGRGIVSTPDNFGKLGSLPSHPKLLDYLAHRFQSDGWSIKKAIRFMVTSETWKRSSLASTEAERLDPENRLWSHFNLRRLDAETIRDQLLWISGKLDTQSMYGKPLTGSHHRRSVYQRVKRNDLDSFLSLFDAPTPSSTTGRRENTNVPGQSLKLLNDPFVIDCAENWAADGNLDAMDLSQRITTMFERSFGRSPTFSERTQCELFIQEMVLKKKNHHQKFLEITTQKERWEETLQQMDEQARARVRKERSIALQSPEPQGPEPFAAWDFSKGPDDQMGQIKLKLEGGAKIQDGALWLDGKAGYARSEPINSDIREKTLEAWVQLDNLNQRGGGILSLQDLGGDVFDAIVFAEQEPHRWLAGSNVFARTQSFQGGKETSAANEWIHIALVYEIDGTIRAYRNGEVYGKAYQSSGPVAFGPKESQLLLGNRHGAPSGNRLFKGRIAQARLYTKALSHEEIQASFHHQGDWIPQSEWMAAFTEDERSQRASLEIRIADTEKFLAENSLNPGLSNPWADLAHAFFNLKELIYVR